MHVGKTKQKFKCTPFLLDNWTEEEIENKTTGKVEFKEKYERLERVHEKTVKILLKRTAKFK